jgi:hypothetical protein
VRRDVFRDDNDYAYRNRYHSIAAGIFNRYVLACQAISSLYSNNFMVVAGYALTGANTPTPSPRVSNAVIGYDDLA